MYLATFQRGIDLSHVATSIRRTPAGQLLCTCGAKGTKLHANGSHTGPYGPRPHACEHGVIKAFLEEEMALTSRRKDVGSLKRKL